MSQTDMTVANGSGSAVRDDIEDHLQALASTSKGNAAPSTKYAGQHYIDDNTPSVNVWTESVWDGADGIALWYIDTASNVAYPVSAMPLLGFSAQGSPVMTGDIRTSAATAVPGSGNSTLGYNLAANGTLHLSNNGSYVASVNRNSSGIAITFGVSGTQAAYITLTSTTGSLVSASDVSKKTHLVPFTGAEAIGLARQINVWLGNWKADPLGHKEVFLLAHEFAAILPTTVHGEAPNQGIAKAEAVPLLFGIAKGLLELVDQLAARLAALEARGES